MARVRLKDIAEIVGVSNVTVSKVLSQTAGNNTFVGAETAKRILDVARQLGYQPNFAARQLVGKGSRLIGVLIDANSIFGEFGRIVYEEQCACAKGYRMIVGQCHPDMEEIRSFLSDFGARSVEGVIMHAHAYPSLCAEIMKSCAGMNVVYYDRPDVDSPSLNYVDIDHVAGLRKLVRHLVQTGRRKITYFAPYMKFKAEKFRTLREKERGFKEAMAAEGLPFDADFGERHLFNVEPGLAEIDPLIKSIVRNESPDAIIARNDEIAAMVLRSLADMGVKCPDDIVVAGSDNNGFAQYLRPSLTTVDPNLALASKAAVETLIKIIESGAGDDGFKTTIEPELIIREST